MNSTTRRSNLPRGTEAIDLLLDRMAAADFVVCPAPQAFVVLPLIIFMLESSC